jgi:hypothetical protein
MTVGGHTAHHFAALESPYHTELAPIGKAQVLLVLIARGACV